MTGSIGLTKYGQLHAHPLPRAHGEPYLITGPRTTVSPTLSLLEAGIERREVLIRHGLSYPTEPFSRRRHWCSLWTAAAVAPTLPRLFLGLRQVDYPLHRDLSRLR